MTAKRQWTLVTALVCLLVLVVGFMLLVKPQHSKASSVKSQTTTVQGQVQSLRAQLSTLQEESRNLASQQAVLAEIVQQLPAQPALPALLRSLDAAAAQTNVDLTNVSPGNPTAFKANPAAVGASGTTGSTTTTTTTSTGTASAVPGLAQIPLSLSVTGSYFDIEQFLDQLEGLQRSMLVDTFTIGYQASQGGSSGPPTVGTGELTVSIQAEVFMTTAALGSATPATGTPSTAAPAAK
ncbi:MAG TPA: type 4a pilus biogenesis protein PilO [Mycobacteriales bacterium]